MALFQRIPGSGSSEFGSLFRLLDDYDAHRQQAATSGGGTVGGRALSSFAPKFDVRELQDSYVLDGDLPGVDQEDISIEFSDPNTLVVRGRTESHYQAGTPPAGMGTKGAIEGGDGGKHQPRVEEEGEAGTTAAAAGSSTGTKQTTTEQQQQQQQQQPQHQPQQQQGKGQGESKYWVSERSVGEFQRSFSFPTRVDQDAVKATLKKGVLNIVVPKMTAAQSKRIPIE